MVRVAVIGCGRIAEEYKKVFLRNSDKVSLICAVDKDIERAKRYASFFNGCKATTDIDAMLAMRPDAVHVLTPHFLHCSHVIRCLEQNINVLTEKPLGISMEEARAMIDAEKRSEAKLGVIFQNRYIEGVQTVKRLINEGAFGKITGAWSHLAWYRPESYYRCDWKGYWDKEGGGVVIDQAIHSLDLVRYMLGDEVTSIQGHFARRILTNIEVEDEADAVLKFSKGAIYAFSACNYYTSNSPIEIEISGEKGKAFLRGGTMTISLDGKDPYTISPSHGENNDLFSYWGNYHELQILDFYSSIQKGMQPNFTAEDASITLALVLGIYQSGRMDGKEIAPPCLVNQL